MQAEQARKNRIQTEKVEKQKKEDVLKMSERGKVSYGALGSIQS
jgi:hypothetical protein